MSKPSELNVVPKALPRDVKWSDDPRARAMADMLETFAFKMYHTALRFEDDGETHIPTYGLRLAADEFSRAAHSIFCESTPLPKPIKVCVRSHVKLASIGLRAFAKSLEDDWKLVQVKCGAHCKLCSSRCGAAMAMAMFEILLQGSEGKEKLVPSKQQKEIKTVFERASTSMQSYAEQVTKNDSFSDTARYWEAYADDMEKIAEYLHDLL